MGFMIMKLTQGLASLLVLGFLCFGIYKFSMVMMKGLIDNNKEQK